jgi:gliding motility-associated-like protein
VENFISGTPTNIPVSNNEIYDPVAYPLDSTTYFVTIIDENGCEITDSTTVLVAADPISNIKAVNMITPNGDGKNDFLEFRGLQKFGTNTLKIYNRWGALIFQKVNYHHDEEVFNGTYKEQPLPAGNYYYVLSLSSGEIKQKLTIVSD